MVSEQVVGYLLAYGQNLVDLESAGTHNGIVADVGREIVRLVELRGHRCTAAVTRLYRGLIRDNRGYADDTALLVIGETLRKILHGREKVERKELDYSKLISASHTKNVETYDERQRIAVTLTIIRKNRGLSRIKMSKFLGIRPSRYHRYELGVAKMREEDEDKIKNKLNFTIEELFILIKGENK